ncbi:MAG: hypothetical protein KGK11_08610 [Sphingomonadales bacterium]|nr:hypothetical protein [Sphingomonadales bacterium]
MRRLGLIATFGLLAAAPSGAGGPWHVTGDVAGHGFVLDCTFSQSGAQLAGACIEAGGSDSHVKPGKVHKLSEGSVAGSAVRWAYPVSVMLLPIDIRFTGTASGDHMTGTVTAAGRKGSFTAVRT